MQERTTDALADVLTGVTRTLSTAGFSCLVEILTDGQPARRLHRPRPEDEAASWAQLSMVLDSGPELVLTKTWVGVRFEGLGPDGAYVGALVARSHIGSISPGDGARIQRVVRHAMVRDADPRITSDVRLPEAARLLQATAVRAGAGPHCYLVAYATSL